MQRLPPIVQRKAEKDTEVAPYGPLYEAKKLSKRFSRDAKEVRDIRNMESTPKKAAGVK